MNDIKKPNQVVESSNARPTIVGDSNKSEDAMLARPKLKNVAPLARDAAISKQSIDISIEKRDREEAAVADIASSVTTKRENEFAEEKQLVRLAEVEKLIDSKQYYLPIKQNSSGVRVVAGVFVLILFAGAVSAVLLLA